MTAPTWQELKREKLGIQTVQVFTDFEVTSDQFVDIPQLEVDVVAGEAYQFNAFVSYVKTAPIDLLLRGVLSASGDVRILTTAGVFLADEEIINPESSSIGAAFSLSGTIVAGANGTFKLQVRSAEDNPEAPSAVEPGSCIVLTRLDS